MTEIIRRKGRPEGGLKVVKDGEVCEKSIVVYPTICSVFGCSRELSLFEKLCGSKCVLHQKINPL